VTIPGHSAADIGIQQRPAAVVDDAGGTTLTDVVNDDAFEGAD
jgi:hypothetical protein